MSGSEHILTFLFKSSETTKSSLIHSDCRFIECVPRQCSEQWAFVCQFVTNVPQNNHTYRHRNTHTHTDFTSDSYGSARQAALPGRTLLCKLEAVQRRDGREQTGVTLQTGWGKRQKMILNNFDQSQIYIIQFNLSYIICLKYNEHNIRKCIFEELPSIWGAYLQHVVQ